MRPLARRRRVVHVHQDAPNGHQWEVAVEVASTWTPGDPDSLDQVVRFLGVELPSGRVSIRAPFCMGLFTQFEAGRFEDRAIEQDAIEEQRECRERGES